MPLGMVFQRVPYSCGLLATKWAGNDKGLVSHVLSWSGTYGLGIRWLGKSTAGRPPPQSISIEQRYRPKQEIRFQMDSAGTIGDPYPGPRPWLTPMDLFHRKGWRELRSRALDIVKDLYSIRLCQKHIDGFKFRLMKAEAMLIYEKVCQASASGDKDAIRKLTTAEVMAHIKKETSARKAAGCHRVQWSLSPTGSNIKFLRARVLGLPDNEFSPAFAQLTYLFRNKQRFAMYNAKGERIGGSEDTDIDVEDCWVFERLMKKDNPATRWRVVARMTLPTTT